MANLVMLSDLAIGRKRLIDDELLKLLKSKNLNPAIGYIPSCSDPNRIYFKSTVEYYKAMGINSVSYFDLDMEYDESKLSEVFNFDALHLSGGNTFYFLSTIRKRNFINMIRSYVMNNGILIGVSAGSILMTNSIELAGFGDYADQNFVGITDLSSLGLVNFEFLPHWDGSTDGIELLRKYSKMKDTIIYACRDNDGIIVNNDKVKLIGQIEIIHE